MFRLLEPKPCASQWKQKCERSQSKPVAPCCSKKPLSWCSLCDPKFRSSAGEPDDAGSRLTESATSVGRCSRAADLVATRPDLARKLLTNLPSPLDLTATRTALGDPRKFLGEGPYRG